MPRRAAAISQADVARTLRAVQASGGGWRVEILPGGIISLLPMPAGDKPFAKTGINDERDDGTGIVL